MNEKINLNELTTNKGIFFRLGINIIICNQIQIHLFFKYQLLIHQLFKHQIHVFKYK